ncbi:DUF262 domain-containing protein [Candidatus Poribacteria bacterium]|nr:DUF262 domain-containing protein [Candidatus Poribacteria bacterium]
MKATETKLLDFLQGPKQFIIPIYQRTYSWTQKQCEQLWNDIRRTQDPFSPGHFIGSIVYIERGLYHTSSVPHLLVIDGQQRLTTISLLLEALARAIEQQRTESLINPRRLRNYYLFNAEEEDDLRFKLLLTQNDKPTLCRLLTHKSLPQPHSRRIVENHAFFTDRIAKSGVDLRALYEGISKLIVVDISLDRGHDNPQLIFESLNSTGLELSQADLIRNYVLMGLEPKEQNELYSDYWFPMEQSFGHADYAAQFDRFMRDYLTVKTGTIPNIRAVYEEFKAYVQSLPSASIHEIVADIYRFSQFFVRFALEREPDGAILEALNDVNTLKVDVAYPFLLELFDDWEQGRIERDGVLEILRLTESYVFRRAVCGIPTNSLNKTFATLARELDKERYVESFKAALLLKDSYRRFPDDEEFKRELAAKDLYNFRSRNYWLRRLENHERRERVNVDEYTIEHVMPQNENLSPEWRSELGDDWRQVHARYLHTLGNLTLTRYNPELRDRPFGEKREMAGGFRDSPLRLNDFLRHVERWNAEAINARAETLANKAVVVWTAPRLEEETLTAYRGRQRRGQERTYSLDDFQYLTGDMRTLFEQLRQRVLNLDAAVTEEILKLYIAYKTTTNFVDVVPQKSRLRLSLNLRFDEINDPQGWCRDVTDIGRWGNGDVEVGLATLNQLDYAMFLIRQAFGKHAANGDE